MPFDLTASSAVTVAGAAYVVALVVEQTKWLTYYVVKPTDPNQNLVVRCYVALVAFVIVAGWSYLTGTDITRATVLQTIITSATVTGAAIGGYAVLSRDASLSHPSTTSDMGPGAPADNHRNV